MNSFVFTSQVKKYRKNEINTNYLAVQENNRKLIDNK